MFSAKIYANFYFFHHYNTINIYFVDFLLLKYIIISAYTYLNMYSLPNIFMYVYIIMYNRYNHI